MFPSEPVLLNPSYPASFINRVKEATADVQLKDHVWVSSSGTTSNGSSHKMVALSQRAIESSALAVNRFLKATSSDRWIQVLPGFHVGGLGVHVRASLTGSQVVSGLKNGRWDPAHFSKISSESGATLAALVPTQIFDLISAGIRSPTSLRAVIVGGGAMSEVLYFKARKLGWNILPSYGMSEACSQIATAPLSSLLKQSFPTMELLPHLEAKTDEQSRLVIKGQSLFSGYLFISENETYFLDPKVDGWFTGEDRVTINQNQVLFLGRDQDFAKINGENVSLKNLQNHLEMLTASQEFILLTVESSRSGHEIQMATTNRNYEKVLKTFNESVLPFERIQQVHHITKIPRTDLGKVQIDQLKKIIWSR